MIRGSVSAKRRAYCTVIALSMVLEDAYAHMTGPVRSVSEAMFEETLTIRGEDERRSSGSAALMTRIAPSTWVSTSARAEVLLREARNVFDVAAVAVERSRRTGQADDRLVLVTKAGASHEVLRDLLDTYAGRPGALPVEVLLCELGEQRQVLRQGRADAALVHAPYDVLGGFDTQELLTEGQVAIVPEGHPLARRPHTSLAEVAHVPDLPIARWPRHDGSYPPGPGPEVHTQSEIAQLVSLGRALLVIPESSRAWQWPDHVAVPVLDAPPVTTLLAWPAGARSAHLDGLVRAAADIAERATLDALSTT